MSQFAKRSRSRIVCSFVRSVQFPFPVAVNRIMEFTHCMVLSWVSQTPCYVLRESNGESNHGMCFTQWVNELSASRGSGRSRVWVTNETNQRDEPVWFVRFNDFVIRTNLFATEPPLVYINPHSTVWPFSVYHPGPFCTLSSALILISTPYVLTLSIMSADSMDIGTQQ